MDMEEAFADWESPAYRALMAQKLDSVLLAAGITWKDGRGAEMENKIFQRARDCEQYTAVLSQIVMTISRRAAALSKPKLHPGWIIEPNGVAIGIALGSSFTRVSLWRGDKAIVIPDDRGNLSFPNCVAFTDEERLIGEDAKNQVTINPLNSIFNFTRLLGRQFNDEKVQQTLTQWPCKIVDQNGYPRFMVNVKGEEKLFAPEEITAMILAKIKEMAETYLTTPVVGAVISVPGCCDEVDQEAISRSGTIAGLHVLQVIKDTAAAAVAYDKRQGSIDARSKKNVLVFSMGGGSTSVSVVTIENSYVYHVRSTAADTFLGGEEFDQKLAEYFVEEFNKESGKDMSGDTKAICKLKVACEEAKRTLTVRNVEAASIVIDSLHEGVDFNLKITRSLFDDLCSDLFVSILKLVEQALTEAKLGKNDIDYVVLVGGSCLIPKVQKLLQDFFEGKELKKFANADEAVVYGAALQAIWWTTDFENEKIPEIYIINEPQPSHSRMTSGSQELSTEEIKRMKMEVQKYKDEDHQKRELTIAANKLKNYIVGVKTTVDEASARVAAKHQEVNNLIERRFLFNKEHAESKLNTIRKELEPLMLKVLNAAKN